MFSEDLLFYTVATNGETCKFAGEGVADELLGELGVDGFGVVFRVDLRGVCWRRGAGARGAASLGARRRRVWFIFNGLGEVISYCV